MINALLAYFEQFTTLNKAEKQFIREHVPIREVKKNELLLKEGEVSTEFYFVIQGAIRLFYNVDLTERTGFFYFERTFVSAYESFTKQVPAKHNFQAIEPSTVAVISTTAAQKILTQYPKFEFLARVMMEEELIVCQEIISSFVTQNAEERYKNLLTTKSPILQRIPQHQLATYLGVTAETLSRIRKRIVQAS